MDTTSVQRTYEPSTRNRTDHNYAQQVAADDAARQKKRAERNKSHDRRDIQSELMRHITQEAMRNSLEQERIRERQNMQAGIEKMVRTVVRKESEKSEETQQAESTQNSEANQQASYNREKVNSAYSSFVKESPRERDLRPSPSELQQKRAVDQYQDSNRNAIDRTVELVV
ncbi:MAG: hypothetical protein OEY52_13135 [Gammaproteobacteria bacterium]|nr:hypothetical protein [Gammaproteobacteria bacterium]